MKTSIVKATYKVLLITPLLFSVGVTQANGWGGNNNFFGSNNGYNDWPVWTPMYWMEEMFGNNNRNRFYGNNSYYSNPYRNPYQSHYIPPQALLNGYGANPYSSLYSNPYRRQPVFPNNRYQGLYSQVQPRQYQGQYYVPRAALGTTPFATTRSNPFSAFGGNGMNRSFPSFGGGMPMNNFGSPMSGGFGSPFSSPFSPMSGFGSPMMPMSSMGMSGMSPMSGFGGSPFGGGFTPFR